MQEFEAYIYNYSPGEIVVNIVPYNSTEHGFDECSCNPKVTRTIVTKHNQVFNQVTIKHNDIQSILT